MDDITVKIGDRIIGKKIGAMIPSTVIGIMSPMFYFNGVLKLSLETATIPSWDEHYPDWKDKLIVVGLYDEPQCPYTFHEVSTRIKENPYSFLNGLKQKINLSKEVEDAILKVEYANSDKSHTVGYPIEDVEVI